MAIVNPDAFGAVGDGLTDDTAAFNAASAAVRSTGGVIEVSPNAYKIVSWDLTNMNSVIVRGQGGGISGPQGAKLVQGGGTYPIVDMTASAVHIEHLQIGVDGMPDMACGVMAAQNAAFIGSSGQGQAATLISMRRVFITGSFSQAAFYGVSVGDSVLDDCQFRNRYCSPSRGANSVMTLARSNNLGVPSLYQQLPLNSQEFGVGSWDLRKVELHDFNPGVRPPWGCALLLIGAQNVSLTHQCKLDSSTSSQGAIIFLNSSAGHPCGRLALDDFVIYSENGPGYFPQYGIYGVPGSTLDSLYVNNKSVSVSAGTSNGGILSQKGIDAPL